MPKEISSTLIPVFSQRFAISLIKVIFVARKALEAYFISSAPLLFVAKKLAPLFIKGKYRFFIIVNALSWLEPITILSGYLKSLIASPSLKNSGLEITVNFFLFFKIFSIRSPVPTGTVDFVIIIFFFLEKFNTSLATCKIYFKSTDNEFFLFGVPTHINTIFLLFSATEILVVKNNLLALWFAFINSSKPGSKIGDFPEFNLSILFLSLSTQNTV